MGALIASPITLVIDLALAVARDRELAVICCLQLVWIVGCVVLIAVVIRDEEPPA